MTTASAKRGQWRMIAGLVVACSHLFVAALMIWLFFVFLWPGDGFEPPECWRQIATCGPAPIAGLLAVILSLVAAALVLVRSAIYGRAYWTGDQQKPSAMSHPVISIVALALVGVAFIYVLGQGGLPPPLMDALSTHKSIAWLAIGLVLLFGEFWASLLGWGIASMLRHRG